MKTKRYLILLMSITLVFAQCTELEEEPVGLLAPEAFFRTGKDVETAVLGTYGLVAAETMYGRKLTLTLQLRSDMADIGDRGTPARRQQVNDFNMDANNGMITAFWPQSYEVIGAANAAISGAEKLQGSESEEVLNALIAEARFVRAFTYYHLVRLFGDIPYIDAFINNPDEISDISKTPQAEVYQNIIEDLQFAKQWLPDQAPGGVRTRPSKGAAAAYLSSVYLTQGQYQQAYDEAKYVIDNSTTFGYALEDDFQDLFNASIADDLVEPIFAIDFLANTTGSGSQNQDWMGPVTGIRGSDDQGWSVSVPTMAVYNSWDERDYRKHVSYDDTTLVDGVPVPYTEFQAVQRPHIAKYMRYCGDSRGDCGGSDINYLGMRYGEVLLIAAEALNEINGPNPEVLGYINQIRARARNWSGRITDFPMDVTAGLSKDEFRDLVLEERRLELAFEFKRWYDIKRRQLGEEVFLGPDALEPHDNFNTNKYLMPLPQDELDRNPNLMPQNPGF